MIPKTLFDKIWDSHVVKSVGNEPEVIYIDRHYIHEVTSPQAFDGLRARSIPVLRPGKTVAMADHNIPTKDQHLTLKDEVAGNQVKKLEDNCRQFGIEYFGPGHPDNGIVHVAGPELGYTLTGMTIVCGDSHTSTHGAFGNIAFGIGTSEVEMVLATQCIIQSRPKQMRIRIDGTLRKGVTAKDLILYIISKVTAGGATGYFVEYSGTAIESMSMEERMTVCNMSIEMGSRGGLIAPDHTTYEYLNNIPSVANSPDFKSLLLRWRVLKTDEGAKFDREITFDAAEISPMITYGTNPGMGIAIDETIPGTSDSPSFMKSLGYMGFSPGMNLLGHPIDFVFLGSCTNGRIEDLRAFATIVKGRKKAPGITALLVPGSQHVRQQAVDEGLADILQAAGFELREPGCSSCLAMNDDKVPPGKLAVSTSNRNFEGRQGPGARTILASPLTAAAAAVTGKITDPRDLLNN